MTNERSRYGLLVSSLGAALLAGSLFLPWYRVSATGAGAGSLGHFSHGAIALPGQHLGALTAEQALSALTIILLVLAGLALLDALLPLARSGAGVPAGAGGAVVLLGMVASACVLYRMIALPAPSGEAVALSLREGPWLALLSSMMVALGGLWPASLPGVAAGEAFGGDIWASLTGGSAPGR